jgi:hypothetical protein
LNPIGTETGCLPFACEHGNRRIKLGLERAIGLRWTLRDIQARRLKMSQVSDEDLRVLTGLGLIEEIEEGPVLTQAGTAVLGG